MSLLEDAKNRQQKNEIIVNRLELLNFSANLPLNRC